MSSYGSFYPGGVVGLYNPLGMQHCFLNVCVQAFACLHSLREEVVDWILTNHGETCPDEACVLCPLRDLLIRILSTQGGSRIIVLEVDALRKALSLSDLGPERFPLAASADGKLVDHHITSIHLQQSTFTRSYS